MDVLIIFLLMLVLFFLGAPIGFGILTGMVYYLFFTGQTMEVYTVVSNVTLSSDSYVLVAVPFFMLAAELMNRSGITDRIFDFAKALVGHIPGGLGHVNVVASMIFAGMSGSGMADTSGLGKVEIKAMKDAGYDPAFSAAVTASSGIIGPIIPPSICMVIGAVVTNTSVGRMLLGGALPGIFMGLALMVMVYILARRGNYPVLARASRAQCLARFRSSLPALLTPLILVGGIVSGICTPTEAAVIACVYALGLSCFLYRAFHFKSLFQVFVDTGKSAGALLFILAAASALGKIAVRSQIPQKLALGLVQITTHPVGIMVIIVAMLVVMGMLMEDLSLLVIMGPLLMPVVTRVGIDPVHFGVVMVLTLQLAMITPPVGVGFYIACYYAEVDMVRYARTAIWFFLALLLVVLVMVCVPEIVTLLPDLVFD